VIVEVLTARLTPADLEELDSLLVECVESGASIGFLSPLTADESAAYWRKIVSELTAGTRLLCLARETPGGRIVGGAQLALETRPNGRHRAEVQKVMVRPSHRRRGVATRLMTEIEACAGERGVWLLFLDTSDSHAGARAFYEKLGYVYVGGIPGFALDPHGRPEPNAIFYKTLAPRE
jgi:GNAT superfamily N-acetyltransferase